MKHLAAPFQQLVERRLWPLAVLLVAALVAVPMVLPAEPEAPAPVAAPAPGQGTTEPIVSVADASRTDTERKVLGSRKNPFRPAIAAKPPTQREADSAQAPKAGDGGRTVSGGGDAGAGASGGAPAPSAPVPPASQPEAPETVSPKTVYELRSLWVKFGPSTGPLARRNIVRLTGLPGGRRPAVLYIGLKDDHRTAVFMVDARARIQGDGRCAPGPDNCQTLALKPGETVFIDLPDGRQYQLDLLRVVTRRTTSAREAQAARAAEAPGGRAVLRRNVDRVGPYRYSTRAGHLKVVSRREMRAAASRLAASVSKE